jgi:hypothetical protein
MSRRVRFFLLLLHHHHHHRCVVVIFFLAFLIQKQKSFFIFLSRVVKFKLLMTERERERDKKVEYIKRA